MFYRKIYQSILKLASNPHYLEPFRPYQYINLKSERKKNPITYTATTTKVELYSEAKENIHQCGKLLTETLTNISVPTRGISEIAESAIPRYID